MSNFIPLDHLQRAKSALRSTIKSMQTKIRETTEAGKIPGDYSLGFINGLLFCDHKINLRPGQPLFYNRTTSVGSLPVPTKLTSGDATKDTTTYQVLMDTVLVKTRNLFKSGIDSSFFISQMEQLEQAIKDLDTFVEGNREGLKDGTEQVGIREVPNGELQHPS